MDDLTQALEGLPGFVGQLDLHQHSYDANIAERLVNSCIEDLWTLFGTVQRKLTPYVDLLGINQRDDIQSSLNGSLASSVSIVLPTRRGPGKPKCSFLRSSWNPCLSWDLHLQR